MSNRIISTAQVHAELRSRGVEPMFKIYTGPSQLLTFRCFCPEQRPGKITFRALHYQGGRPMCPECQSDAQRARMRANRRDQTPKLKPAPERSAAIAKLHAAADRTIKTFADYGITPLSEYKDQSTPIPFICNGSCGGLRAEITPAALRSGKRPRCSKCFENSRLRGEEHPRWNPARPEADRDHDRTGADRRWEKAVLRVHDNICVITERRGYAPHHQYGHSGYPKLRLLLQNGVCLIRTLHIEFTRRFPKGDNTFADFVAFYEEKTGRPCPMTDPMLIPVFERIFID